MPSITIPRRELRHSNAPLRMIIEHLIGAGCPGVRWKSGHPLDPEEVSEDDFHDPGPEAIKYTDHPEPTWSWQ